MLLEEQDRMQDELNRFGTGRIWLQEEQDRLKDEGMAARQAG